MSAEPELKFSQDDLETLPLHSNLRSQLLDRIERLRRYEGMKMQTDNARECVASFLREHVSLLEKQTGHQKIDVTKIEFHDLEDWRRTELRVYNSITNSAWRSFRREMWDDVMGSLLGTTWEFPQNIALDFLIDRVMNKMWSSIRSSEWGPDESCVFHSLWAQAHDSMAGSIRSSVVYPDSMSPFLPELKILECGGVFYGIEGCGIAHVIMPSMDEITGRK